MHDSNVNPRRSWLLVSPLEDQKIHQALETKPDVVVIDLFERVPESRRDEARDSARMAVERCSETTEVFGLVHIDTLSQDLDALVWTGLSGVIVSRAESAENISTCSDILSRLESIRSLPLGTTQIVPSLETSLGNYRAMEIATVTAARRVWGLTLGRADLEMDLRAEPSGEIHLMPYLMQRLIIIAVAAGITPLGAWWRHPDRGLLSDTKGTYEAAIRGRAIGFKGTFILGPHQVESVNRAYV